MSTMHVLKFVLAQAICGVSFMIFTQPCCSKRCYDIYSSHIQRTVWRSALWQNLTLRSWRCIRTIPRRPCRRRRRLVPARSWTEMPGLTGASLIGSKLRSESDCNVIHLTLERMLLRRRNTLEMLSNNQRTIQYHSKLVPATLWGNSIGFNLKKNS